MQKAEIFNHHFKSVFTRENLEDFPSKGPSSHPTIENVTISTTGILKLLNELNIYKACGPDGINTRILKETSDVIAHILRVIFQLSLDTGIVPNDWKIANVVPVYKKGDRAKPSNYRPISLTCITCKLFENIIYSLTHHATP